MTAAEVLIKIRTMFERKGATEATDALKQTASTAKQTGQQVSQTGKQVAQAGQSGADGLNVMSAATAAMNGNFAGAATALVPLITKIKALGVAMTSVSLVMAALTLVYMAFSKIAEYATKAAEAVADFNAKSRKDMIEAVTRAYARQADEMDRVSKLRDIELERILATNEANKAFEVASNRRAKLKELSSTTDETKRSEIEEKYAREEQKITGKFDSNSEQAEYERMKKREVELWQLSETNAREILQKKAIIRRTEQSAVDADNAAEKHRLEPWGIGNGAALKREEEAKDARKDAETYREELEKLEKNRVNLADEAKRVRYLKPSTQRRMEASALERQNVTAQQDISDSDKRRVEQDAKYTEFERLQTIAQRLHPVDVEAIAADLERASKMMELTAPYIKRLADSAERTVKAFDDNEARQRNIQ